MRTEGPRRGKIWVVLAFLSLFFGFFAQVLAFAPPRAVEVKISPPLQVGEPRESLVYVVEVRNLGLLPDLFELKAQDARGWGISISPPQLYIPARGLGVAALVVTIPQAARAGEENPIILKVQGTLSKGTPTDRDNSQASSTCIAKVSPLRGVDLLVLPSISQTAPPGAEVRWVVNVINRGNAADVFRLEVSELVSGDQRPSWGAVLDNLEVLIPPGQSEVVLLTVNVPPDAETGASNRLVVRVSSLSDPGVRASKSCEVHVLKPIERVHKAHLTILVEAEVLAVEVRPQVWDFGVIEELEVKHTENQVFRVRNVGNLAIDVTIRGSDAQSLAGEPLAKWELSPSGEVGVNRYAMWFRTNSSWVPLSKSPKFLALGLEPSQEVGFDLKIQAPSAITVQARMWTSVLITAIRA